MDAQWICDACGWDNPGTRVCERCGQALHWQQDPPLDMPGAPSPAMLPEFWSFLLWTLLSLAGVVVTLLPVGSAADIPWYWLAVHLLVFGTASLGALRNLMFRLWFYRVEFSTPAHARSGTMIDAQLRLLPYRTVSGVHVTISFREIGFTSQGNLRTRTMDVSRLNRGAPLRGRREHLFSWSFPAPTPLGRYMHLGTEMQVSLWRFLGRFLPEVGIAASQLRQDGGWFVQLRLRRGLFSKVIERRVVLYSPGMELLVG